MRPQTSAGRVWSIQICMLAEEIGSIGTSDLMRCAEISSPLAYDRITRLVGKKLLVADRSKHAAKYSVAKNWREIIGDVDGVEPLQFVARPGARRLPRGRYKVKEIERERGAPLLDRPSKSVGLMQVWGWVRPVKRQISGVGGTA